MRRQAFGALSPAGQHSERDGLGPAPSRLNPAGDAYRARICPRGASVSVVVNAHTILPFHTPAVARVAGRASGAQHADAICPASWTAPYSYLIFKVARLAVGYVRDPGIWLMKRGGRHGLCRGCNGEDKGDTNQQSDHCFFLPYERQRHSARYGECGTCIGRCKAPGLTSLVAPNGAQIFPEARGSHSTQCRSLHSTKCTRVRIGRHGEGYTGRYH